MRSLFRITVALAILLSGATAWLPGNLVASGLSAVFPWGPVTLLPPVPNTSLYGSTYLAGLGAALAAVGDVNGDGYDDVVAGAPYYRGPSGSHDGRAYLFLGSASGLNPIPTWTVAGSYPACDNYYCNLGSSVAAAGDVNGDSYADVIVTTGRWSNGQYDEGRVSVPGPGTWTVMGWPTPAERPLTMKR